jgi:flavin reductase ActVB
MNTPVKIHSSVAERERDLVNTEMSSRFRDAMAAFPSGVTIVTTTDSAGRWWGFTASSFCSVSMDPPLVLVCLANSAECYPVFREAEQWVIHVIRPDHADLAYTFATRGADKFAGDHFRSNGRGLPVLESASAALHCLRFETRIAGDHTILLGQVVEVDYKGAESAPAIYFRRAFHRLIT